MVEVMETSYPDMTSAISRGGVSSGWIPEWLPASAICLREVHNIDTNESALAFNMPSNARWRPPSQCREIPASAVIPSRYRPAWWPSPSELDSSYAFYRCPSDVSLTSVFVGVHETGGRGLHWRVTAR